jgi:hypothetical protein
VEERALPPNNATVQLPNAGSAQSVVGGTVKLPSSGAVPPGLWFKPELPGPDNIIAVYAPLRAVKGGWSGLTSHGWRRVEREWSGVGTRDRLLFEVERIWFAADGGAAGHQLRVRIGAESQAEEGRARLGFRYQIGRNPPMRVLDATWLDSAQHKQVEISPPQIQLMAPPRVARVSDFAEQIGRLGARAAHEWALAGAVHGVWSLVDFAQQRTPFGRGLRLLELPPRSGMTAQLGGLFETRYRVRIERPLICDAPALEAVRGQAQEEASALGLDMESDAVIEWWLERHGHDGALLARIAMAKHEWPWCFGARRWCESTRSGDLAILSDLTKDVGFSLGAVPPKPHMHQAKDFWMGLRPKPGCFWCDFGGLATEIAPKTGHSWGPTAPKPPAKPLT